MIKNLESWAKTISALIVFLLSTSFSHSAQSKINSVCQSFWKSPSYSYSIEIPEGFIVKKAIGTNIDFKASNIDGSSVVVVVKNLPQEYSGYNLKEIIGDESAYEEEFLRGGKEHFNNLIFEKSGWTTIGTNECFWFDYSEGNPNLYHKNYQLFISGILYTFTLTCDTELLDKYGAIWYRFKSKIEI